MYLGTRQIRTAGKGSGSIELTLPADLRDLVGVACRVTLRDGIRPDIVLQPDLAAARQAFAALWDRFAGMLLPPDADPGTLRLEDFGFGLDPRQAGGGLPFLSWRDGLALAAPPPHPPERVSRCLAAFGQVLAPRLGIAPDLAGGFGAVCGYLACGVAPSAEAEEACDLAGARLLGDLAADDRGLPADAMAWPLRARLLQAAAELFAGWSADPAGHAVLRAAWRRGRSIEMGGS